MHEYSLTLYDAVFRFPLRAALGLWPAIAYRHGGGGTGPDAIDRAVLAARRKARAFFEKHFRITADAPAPHRARRSDPPA